MSHEAAERLRDDKVRRAFLDELIVAGVIATPFSYNELKEVTDRLEVRIRWTERKATVERIRAAIAEAYPREIGKALTAILDAEAAR